MDDLVIPDEGCSIITIDWLSNLEVAVLYTEDAFLEFVQINELDDVISEDVWYENNGTSILLRKEAVPYFIMSFSIASVRIVIHECIHLVDHIFEEKGIPLSAENGETRAYMTDYMCMRVFAALGIELPEPFTEDTSSWVGVSDLGEINIAEDHGGFGMCPGIGNDPARPFPQPEMNHGEN